MGELPKRGSGLLKQFKAEGAARRLLYGSLFSVKVSCPTCDFVLTLLCWTLWSSEAVSDVKDLQTFHPSLTSWCLGPSSTSQCTKNIHHGNCTWSEALGYVSLSFSTYTHGWIMWLYRSWYIYVVNCLFNESRITTEKWYIQGFCTAESPNNCQ